VFPPAVPFLAYRFALALAAALLDATLGYPTGLARRIGSPSGWISAWLAIVKVAADGWSGRGALALYLAPVAVASAAIAVILPDGPIGFAVTALLASTFYGRQSLDARARSLAKAWETEGPYEAFAVAEALGADEADPRLVRAGAAAIAARFADEIAAPTVFILIGGLVGAALCRALVLAGRFCRERRDDSAFGRAVAEAERWTVAPAARAGALFLALVSGGRAALSAVAAPATRPTAPAEAVLVAALGPPVRDDAAYVRRALALYRRAAAAEFVALAALTFAAALAK
jgi:adenosylcobinamide-phosphate synthase